MFTPGLSRDGVPCSRWKSHAGDQSSGPLKHQPAGRIES
jgi:hypothetical protein